MRKLLLSSFLILMLLCSVFAEEKGGLDFKGKLRNDNMLLHDLSLSAHGETLHYLSYGGINLVRLNFKNAEREFAKVEADLDIIMLYGAYKDLMLSSTNSNASPMADLETDMVLLNLRKFYLALYPGFGDIIIGRQIINFGVGMVFSPIDAFSTVDLVDINFERKGSDIIMTRFYFSDLSGLDIITTPSTKMDKSASAVKLYANCLGFDISAVGIYKSKEKEALAGLAFKGDLELGVHGEFVEHFKSDGRERYFESMLGIDYSFFDTDFLFFLDYYYNESIIDTENLVLSDLSKINNIFYNKHYIYFAIQCIISEIENVGSSIVWNINDMTSITTLQYFNNIFQNANLIFYVQHFDGQINDVKALDLFDLIYSVRIEVMF